MFRCFCWWPVLRCPRRRRKGRRRRKKKEGGGRGGQKKRERKKKRLYLVDGPNGERQRLAQERVVPSSPAAVEGRDAIGKSREEADEVARGLGARERRRRCRGRGVVGRRCRCRCCCCCFQERELGDEPIFEFVFCCLRLANGLLLPKSAAIQSSFPCVESEEGGKEQAFVRDEMSTVVDVVRSPPKKIILKTHCEYASASALPEARSASST